MLRKIVCWRVRNLFCTISKPEAPKQSIETNPEFVDDYKKAIQYRSERRFKQANMSLTNILSLVKKEQLVSTNLVIDLMRKQVVNYNDLYEHAEAEKLLQEIVKIIMEKQTSPLLLYGAYEHLANHCLRTNLPRGVKITKALLSGRHKVELPMNYRKIFTLYLGTGYLLLGNYIDAKAKLEECLNDDPVHNIKACALNNLGVACWWQKHPRFNESESAPNGSSKQGVETKSTTQFDQVDRDFSNTLNYFKQSIENFEQVGNMVPGEDQNNIVKLLKEDTSEFIREHFKSEKLYINRNKMSGIPLLNITEFLLHNHFAKLQPMFWLKQSGMFYEQVNPKQNQRALMLLAIISTAQGNYREAEKMIRQVITDLEETDNYLLVMAVELYSNIILSAKKQKSKKAQELFEQAKNLAKGMPAWSNRLPYLAIPSLKF